MKCPFCGKEMEKGVVQSTREFYFTMEPSKYSSVLLNLDTDVRLSGGSILKLPTCTAFRCRDCKKVILDYAEKYWKG